MVEKFNYRKKKLISGIQTNLMFLNHIEFFFTFQYIDFWTKSLYMVKKIFLKNKTLAKFLKKTTFENFIDENFNKK